MPDELEGMELVVVRDPHTMMIAKMCVHFPSEEVVQENAELIEAQQEIDDLREQLAEQQMAKTNADLEKVDRRMDDIGHVPVIVEDPYPEPATFTPVPNQPKSLTPIDMPDTAAQRANKVAADIEKKTLKKHIVKTKSGKDMVLRERKRQRRVPEQRPNQVRISATVSGTRLDSIMAEIDNKLAGL